MADTKIQWANKVWNPVTGCDKVSEGCRNCYAERMANRLRGRCGYLPYDPFQLTLHPDRLEEPLRWRKPSMIFVCSMGDLFHEDVPKWTIWEVMDVILQAKQHTFLVLTKRPANMKRFYDWYYNGGGRTTEPPKNLWLGVTAENQEEADKRIPILLQIPAAVRFVSVEPMLGHINIAGYLGWNGLRRMGDGLLYRWAAPKIDWVICGGESGPNARPMHPDWARNLRDQCQAAGVPFFFKQWGEWIEDDNDLSLSQQLPSNKRLLLNNGNGRYVPMARIGKYQAGDYLDGKQYHEFPEVSK
jgi:protein gp37